MFEGNRDALDEVELPADMPRTMKEALGDEFKYVHMTVSSHGMGPSRGAGSEMRHGHGSKKDTIDIDTEKFFRILDRAILDHYSKPSALPLMLPALPQYHALFRQVSHNPFLMKKGIEINADALDANELRIRAWQIVEPDYAADLAQLGGQFHSEKASGHGDNNLDEVAAAAVHGRVETLLVGAERHIPGRLEAATAHITHDRLEHPEVDDVLDDVAEEVLKKGGRVLVVPTARMPTQTGVAAIYRF